MHDQVQSIFCIFMLLFGGAFMKSLTRLPALPLIANDPYFSIWCAANRLTDADTTHWAGERKRLRGKLMIDGKPYRFLGRGEGEAMETVSLTVTPTSTQSVLQASGVRLSIAFTTPLLLDDPDLMSTPKGKTWAQKSMIGSTLLQRYVQV